MVTVQTNTDTNNHSPLCSLYTRGFEAAFLEQLSLVSETDMVYVLGSEESTALEVLKAHPAVMAVEKVLA